MRDSAEPGMMPDQPSILSIFQHLISSLMLFGGMLAIAIGFDPISKEREARSLKALLAHPVYRDGVINGKAPGGVAALAVPLTDGRAGFAGLPDVCDRRASCALPGVGATPFHRDRTRTLHTANLYAGAIEYVTCGRTTRHRASGCAPESGGTRAGRLSSVRAKKFAAFASIPVSGR